MRRSIRAACAALLFLSTPVDLTASAAEPATGPAQVTEIRLTPGPAGGEIALRFDRDPRWSLFTLVEPYRIVLDFPVLDWQAGTPDLSAWPGVVSVRHGLFRHDIARVVIELDRPLTVRAAYTRLAGRGRFDLVLALANSTEAAFRAEAGWPEGASWRAAKRPAPEPGTVVIAIDPGHGGIDGGASMAGTVEKDVVLDFGRLLAERLAEEPGLSVFMTRDDDRFLTLRERVQRAREAKAHLMLSLHVNALESGRASGAAVYTLSAIGTDSAAEAFAERENRSEVLSGVELAGHEDDVTRLVIDLARRGTTRESVRLAEFLVAEMEDRVPLLSTRPHRRGNFFVLKAPDLPSVLVELGFVSDPGDRKRFRDEAWQGEMIDALLRGIRAWIDAASPGFLAPRG